MDQRYKELPPEKELSVLNKAKAKGLPDGWRAFYDTELHRHVFFTSDGGDKASLVVIGR